MEGAVGSLAHVLRATFTTYYTGEGTDDMLGVVSVEEVPKALKKLLRERRSRPVEAHHAAELSVEEAAAAAAAADLDDPMASGAVVVLDSTMGEGEGEDSSTADGVEGDEAAVEAAPSLEADAEGEGDASPSSAGALEGDETETDAGLSLNDVGLSLDLDDTLSAAAAPEFDDVLDFGGSDDGAESEDEGNEDDDAAALEEMGGDALDGEIFSALRSISRQRRTSLRHALELVDYLKDETERASLADREEAKRIKAQGLLVKAEIPVGESHLTVDAEVLASFGKFGENLIVARQLFDRHNVTLLQRSGNIAFTGAAELPQLRAEEPNYLESTAAMSHRAAIILDEIAARAARTVVASATTVDGDDGGGYGHDAMLGDAGDAAERSEEHERRLKKLARSRARARKVAREKLTGAEHDANEKVLDRMHRKVQFLHNPRFAGTATGPIGPGTMAGEPEPAFRAEPSEVLFCDYEPVEDGSETYAFKLSLRNITMPALTRRLRVIPPNSPFFEIEEPIFPGKKWRPKAQDDHPDIANGAVTGEVAPGMAAELVVRFAPRSRGTYTDKIVLVAEAEKGATQRLEIVLRAQRRPHKLSLPKRVQCAACLVGKSVTTTLNITNSGGPARFALRTPLNMAQSHRHRHAHIGDANAVAERGAADGGVVLLPGEEEGAFAEGGPATVWSSAEETPSGGGFVVRELGPTTMHLPPCFTVSPITFELGTGESTKLSFTFSPESVGEVISAFELVVDGEEENVAVYEVVGPGCEAQLVSEAIDGTLCFSDSMPTLVLGSATLGRPSATITRTLTLRNPTPLALDFVWSLLGEDADEDAPLPFAITPIAANFPPNATMDFIVAFTPDRLGPMSAVATITADGVPNTLREITIIGHGDPVTLAINPPVLLCEATYPGMKTGGVVTLRNTSLAPATFKWRESLTSTARIKPDPAFGTIAPLSKITVRMELTPSDDAENSAAEFIDTTAICDVDDGRASGGGGEEIGLPSLSVRVVAPLNHVAVKVDKPELDFGLVSVNGSAEATLPLRNDTDVAANWECVWKGSESSTTVVCEPSSGCLAPGAQITVRVRLVAGPSPLRVRGAVACTVRGGSTSWVGVRAEVQSPKVYLLTESKDSRVDLGKTHVSVSADASMTLVNVSNLPAPFDFQYALNRDDGERGLTAVFEPQSGILEPKSELKVTLRFTPRRPGRKKAFFYCYIDGMPEPLPLVVDTLAQGLIISYSEITKGDAMSLAPSIDSYGQHTFPVLHDDAVQKRTPVLDFNRPARAAVEEEEAVAVAMPSSPRGSAGNGSPGFEPVGVFERHSVYLCIRNHSGIPTNFALSFKRHGVQGHAVSMLGATPMLNVLDSTSTPATRETSLGGKGAAAANAIRRSDALTATVSGTATGRRNGATTAVTGFGDRKLLSDAHELVERYKTARGARHLKETLKHEEDKKVLRGSDGVAFRCDTSTGVLGPWRAVIIKVSAVGGLPRRYRDEMLCEITALNNSLPSSNATPASASAGDGDRLTKWLTVKVDITGTPLSIDRNCVGLDIGDPQRGRPTRMRWGELPYGSPPQAKALRVVNKSPLDALVIWELAGKAGEQVEKEERIKYYDVVINVGAKGKCSVDLNLRAKEEKDEMDDPPLPFVITRASGEDATKVAQRVPAHSTTHFQLRFEPPQSELSGWLAEHSFDCIQTKLKSFCGVTTMADLPRLRSSQLASLTLPDGRLMRPRHIERFLESAQAATVKVWRLQRIHGFLAKVTATAEFLTSSTEVATTLATGRSATPLAATLGSSPMRTPLSLATPTAGGGKQQRTVMKDCLSVQLESSLIVPKLRVSIGAEDVDNSGERRRALLSKSHEQEEQRKLRGSGYDAEASVDETKAHNADLLSFAVKSTETSSHASYNRSVTLTNDTSAMIEFAVAVEGAQYSLVEAVASAPQPKLLAPTGAQIDAYSSTATAPPVFSSGGVTAATLAAAAAGRTSTRGRGGGAGGRSRKASIPLFQLPPQASVMTVVKFQPKKKGAMRSRGVKLKQEQPEGKMHITFANGVEQNVRIFSPARGLSVSSLVRFRNVIAPTRAYLLLLLFPLPLPLPLSLPLRPLPSPPCVDPDPGRAAASSDCCQANCDALRVYARRVDTEIKAAPREPNRSRCAMEYRAPACKEGRNVRSRHDACCRWHAAAHKHSHSRFEGYR